MCSHHIFVPSTLEYRISHCCIMFEMQNDKAKYSHYTIKRENGTPTNVVTANFVEVEISLHVAMHKLLVLLMMVVIRTIWLHPPEHLHLSQTNFRLQFGFCYLHQNRSLGHSLCCVCCFSCESRSVLAKPLCAQCSSTITSPSRGPNSGWFIAWKMSHQKRLEYSVKLCISLVHRKQFSKRLLHHCILLFLILVHCTPGDLLHL